MRPSSQTCAVHERVAHALPAGASLSSRSRATSPVRNSRSSGSSHSASLGPLVEVAQREEAEGDRRQPLHEEQPLPALQAERTRRARAARRRAVRRPRTRAAIAVRNSATRPGALLLGEPPGEEEDDPREEAGLGRAEQEPQDVEAPRPLDEHHRRREHAPDDHDRGQPAPRAEARQRQVARHAEDHVAEREDAGAEPEDRVAEAEVVLQLELREAHVHAVEVRDHVDHEEERDQPPCGLAEGPFLEAHTRDATSRSASPPSAASRRRPTFRPRARSAAPGTASPSASPRRSPPRSTRPGRGLAA